MLKAGELGFEPRQADPESAVLPLHHSPVNQPKYFIIRLKLNKTSWLFPTLRGIGMPGFFVGTRMGLLEVFGRVKANGERARKNSSNEDLWLWRLFLHLPELLALAQELSTGSRCGGLGRTQTRRHSGRNTGNIRAGDERGSSGCRTIATASGHIRGPVAAANCWPRRFA